MTKTTIRVAAGLMGGLLLLSAGCAAETGPVGESDSALELVRKADYEGQLRYLDEAVSPRPMTAAELGDTEWATPVEVRFYDEWAVAWHAPDRVAETGDPHDVIRVWKIEEHVAISSDDVAPGDEEPSTTTPPSEDGSLLGETPTGATPDTGTSTAIPQDDLRDLPLARIDWLRDYIDEFQTAPPGYHPGCL